MAKTAILMGIMIISMMQSVIISSASKINDLDDVEKAVEQYLEASTILKVKGYGRNLADKDGWTAGKSDPYMEVTATDATGSSQTLKTPHQGGNLNPTWNDYLIFTSKEWKKITVRIMDYDGSGRKPDPLCPTKEIHLRSGSNRVTYNCESGMATVDYIN
jgi:Ca2+-dependent lipid-binding protein